MFLERTSEVLVELKLAGTPVTGVTFTDVTFQYWAEGDDVFQTQALDIDSWVELGSGVYAITIDGGLLANVGGFGFRLSGGSFDSVVRDFFVEPAPIALLATPEKCLITGNVLDIGGEVGKHSQVTFRIANVPKRVGGSLVVADKLVTVPDALGNISVALIRGVIALVEIPAAGIKYQITVPDQPSALLLDLLPPIS